MKKKFSTFTSLFQLISFLMLSACVNANTIGNSRKEIPEKIIANYYENFTVQEEPGPVDTVFYPHISTNTTPDPNTSKIAFFYEKRNKIVVLKEVSTENLKDFDARYIIEIIQQDTQVPPRALLSEFTLDSASPTLPDGSDGISIYARITYFQLQGPFISAGMQNFDNAALFNSSAFPNATKPSNNELFQGTMELSKNDDGSWNFNADINLSLAGDNDTIQSYNVEIRTTNFTSFNAGN